MLLVEQQQLLIEIPTSSEHNNHIAVRIEEAKGKNADYPHLTESALRAKQLSKSFDLALKPRDAHLQIVSLGLSVFELRLKT